MLYDWECRHVHKRSDQDLDFWRGVAAAGSGAPVLELACGTGRLTIPLAAAGAGRGAAGAGTGAAGAGTGAAGTGTGAAGAGAAAGAAVGAGDGAGDGAPIIGLDNNRTMLSAARRRSHAGRGLGGRPLLFVASDMRRFALAARFGLVFVGYNSLQLLTAAGDMVACLTAAREHLRPDGLVGVEVTDFQAGDADDGDTGGGPDGDDWLPLGAAEGMRLEGTLVHNLRDRTSCYRRHFVGDGWTLDDEVVVRSLDRRELGALFDDAGLVAVEWYVEGPTIRALASPR